MTSIPQIYIELIRGIFTLTAVIAGAYIALRVYFRQKEYELLKQRYLEGGVDIIASELEQVLGVVSHNWARCLQICKSFRDTEENFDLKELERGFLEFDRSKFHEIAHHRITSLLGSTVIWEAYQSTMAFAHSANSLYCIEMPEAIRIRCTTALISQDYEDMGKMMIEDLGKESNKGQKYTAIIHELHQLSLMLEADRLNIKGLAMFAGRPEVQQIIARLRAEFPEDD